MLPLFPTTLHLELRPFSWLMNESNVEIWDFLRGMHRVHELVRLRRRRRRQMTWCCEVMIMDHSLRVRGVVVLFEGCPPSRCPLFRVVDITESQAAPSHYSSTSTSTVSGEAIDTLRRIINNVVSYVRVPFACLSLFPASFVTRSTLLLTRAIYDNGEPSFLSGPCSPTHDVCPQKFSGVLYARGTAV